MVERDTGHTAERVEIGKVVDAFGIKGWLKIFSYCDPCNQISAYPIWYLSSVTKPFPVAAARPHNQSLVAKLQGIDDCAQATAYRGCVISITSDSLPPLAEQEYYWYQLVGLEVINMRGERLGTIKRMVATGTHDIVTVSDSQQGAEYFIPYVHQVYIKAIDFDCRKMTVDWDKEWLA